MTFEEFLEQQGYYFRGTPGGGEDAPRSGYARDIGGGDEAYVQFLEGDNLENEQRGYQYQQQQNQPAPPPPPSPESAPAPSGPSGPVTSGEDLDYMTQVEANWRESNPMDDPRYAELYKRNTDYLSNIYGNIYDQPRTFEPAPPPPPEPVAPPAPAPAPAPAGPPPPRPGSLEEFMQQKATERGYEKTPTRYFFEGSEGNEEIDQNRADFQALLPMLKRMDPVYAKRIMDEGDGYSNSVLQKVEQQLKNEYYADPNNFISTRDTAYGKGINTFNEGNEDQKRLLDQINTGQLRIVPVSYEVDNSGEGGPELRTGYELKDARTGQTVQQQVTAIDASKGIFNVLADDRNSSGYFNNLSFKSSG
jgi:hypothetical protein